MTRINKNLVKRLFTIEEYYQIAKHGIIQTNERVELIKGEIIQKNRTGTKHSAVVNRISYLFLPVFSGNAIVQIKGPLQIPDFSETDPDVLLIKFRTDYYETKHPQAKDTYLLIEVANNSLEYDKTVKLPLYAEAGIPEYWIVDIPNQQILMHTQPETNHYRKTEIASLGDTIYCQQFPEVKILVKDILG